MPVNNCKAKKVHVPTQELLHRKKCLLPDDVALSSAAGDGYGQPQGQPLSSYNNWSDSDQDTCVAILATNEILFITIYYPYFLDS